ncbi:MULTISPECIES: LysM peptidoglycan-binding domain-containing M23 family metallopeptidase [unclassified Streptomyces]|uniref:LysM peptidoglycan-binding domain-containing M23 family metallopeptidase n=1 Tax=unclassified Streptomyces TaxID=2593676 RepID=UPI00081AFFDD|nr:MULTISPECIES: LysM peptidoglycan-binding domain-containing M23 family metallopeptidase [unclassified Streptomyces]MYQ50326.1 peptidoglycan DD-metalloendopeptidase family protein [Streptomyces sp. SID4941]SCD38154.1 Murein DD-endopeptidase MepM and murein hydrolase activator NlpD, contain LysM domain [Streptomyces sp. PalvLS-984]SDD70353.1 Murein DD-endopeptidase MepM and murein hydrolase activator NlpD, contain LysM domain [Streptomyces sp. AmelKG-A3]
MPAKGKHRRTTSGPIARGVLAAGAGGAVLALPLFGATGAHAAEPSAPTAESATTATSASTAPAAKKASAPKTYSVVSGDYLSKIAADQKIKGGWQKLYQDNKGVVGDNPSLIFPGMKLTLGAKASGAATQTAPSEAAPSKAAPSKSTESEAAPKASVPAQNTAAESPAPASAAESDSSGWTTPVASANVTTQYRASGASWSSGYHTGSDFQAASGTSVRAIGPGTVVSAGWGGAYGNEVVIQHSDGMYSQYAHLSSLGVSAGQTVTGGQQIGLSGSTGNSTGPHLHFEVRTGPSYGSDVDPIAYLRSHGVSI